MLGKLFFVLRYWLSDPPWDTGITPPEVMAYLQDHPPGTALDLGCGTGTNVITLAACGWRAVGMDFVPRAVRIARRKAHRAGLEEKASFEVGDVLSPGFQEGEFDLVLDIGCFHIFEGDAIRRYAENVSRILKPGGNLLLYAHLKDVPGPGHGATEAGLDVLGEHLTLLSRRDGQESSRPSAWLEFKK